MFQVTVLGYGGVSKLSCSDSTSIKGYPCVYFDGTTTLNELYIHNNGAQTASVKLVLYSGNHLWSLFAITFYF